MVLFELVDESSSNAIHDYECTIRFWDCMGMRRCARVCKVVSGYTRAGVHRYVWDEFSEYLTLVNYFDLAPGF